MSRKISVVMATYNGVKYLREAIDSVLMQTYDQFDFLVIDDASTDETAEVLGKYAARYPGIFRYIVLPENVGQGEAFNRGISETTGEIVSFIDSDDYWYPRKLEMVAKDFRDPDKVAIHQHHLHFLRNGQLQSKTVRPALLVGDMMTYAQSVAKIQGNFVPTSGLSISRKALNWVGPIPAEFRICADGYLTRTTMCFGRLCATDESLGAYRIHDSNHTADNTGWDNERYVNQLLAPQLNVFYAKRAIDMCYVINEVRYSELVNWLDLNRGDHVVVMRMAPPDVMLTFLTALQEAGVCTHLLAPERTRHSFKDLYYQFYSIDDGVIEPHVVSCKVVDELRQFDLKYVLLPFVMSSERYINVQQTVLSMGLGCPAAGITTKGSIYPFRPAAEAHSIEGVLPPAEINTQRLLAIRDKFKGRRAFLIGNGPSLTMSDLDLLKDEVTIASNKIYLAFSETAWRPTVYCVCDDVVARNNHDPICKLQQAKVFTQSVMKYLWDAPLASYMPPQPSKKQKDVKSEPWDLISGCNAGHSVLNMSIKVAFWMGIREVYIIGADHSFVVPNSQTGELIMNNAVIKSKGEINHFHPDYRQQDEEWTMPKLDKIADDFRESRGLFESMGGRIWNASRVTKLDVFDRVDLDEVLQRKC